MDEIKKVIYLFKSGKIDINELQKRINKIRNNNEKNKPKSKNEIKKQLFIKNIEKINLIQNNLAKKANKEKLSIIQPKLSYDDLIKKTKEDEIKKKYSEIMKDEKQIKLEQVKYISKIKDLPNSIKLNILSKLVSIKEFNAEHNYSKKVVLLEGFIVRKVVEQTSFGNFLFHNEIRSLNKLLPYPNFPKLIAFDPDRLLIYMSYCGEMINNCNLPIDWRQQLVLIKNNLIKADVNSNDMLLRNTCILDNKIHIIDFGLDTIFRKNVDYSISKLARELLLLENKNKNNSQKQNTNNPQKQNINISINENEKNNNKNIKNKVEFLKYLKIEAIKKAKLNGINNNQLKIKDKDINGNNNNNNNIKLDL